MEQIVLLGRENTLDKDKVYRYYISPLSSAGVEVTYTSIVVNSYGKKQPSVNQIKACIESEVIPLLANSTAKIILVTDASYAKVLVGIKSKVDKIVGYVKPCVYPGMESMEIVYTPSWQSLYSDPTVQDKIDLCIKALADRLTGTYQEIGSNLLKNYSIAQDSVETTEHILKEINEYPELTCDIETFDLSHVKAGLGTISFAYGYERTYCIAVEYGNGRYEDIVKVKHLLRNFFDNYKGKLIFHNATFDIKCLIYSLYMEEMLDTRGLVTGLNKLCANFEDTKLIAYLATNSCTGNNLSLKALAHQFVGDYAIEDINDIHMIPFEDLAEYNMIDCIATQFVYDKYYPIMVKDNQLDTYIFFKQILVNIIQMELTGMPIDIERTKEVYTELTNIIHGSSECLLNSKLMQDFTEFRKDAIADERNNKYKQKQITGKDVEYVFNPSSNKELVILLHDYLGFPIVDKTPTGQPAVGNEQIQALLKSANDEEKEVLNSILSVLEGIKIRNTFVKRFLEAEEGSDGWHYLFGSFHLGGTKSGRLSSSKPNLQNIPNSGSTYGKLIKSCFAGHDGYITLKYDCLDDDKVDDHDLDILTQIYLLAHNNIIKVRDKPKFYELQSQLKKDYSEAFDIHPGWFFFGIDFNALEDKINALLTKDPNKMKIYTEGYDSHCFRTVAYNKDVFAHIDPTDVNQVNSIVDTPIGKKLRQESKAASFALAYQGTYHTLMKNCGFNEYEARQLEANYHQLYKVSNAWLQQKLDQASIDGYVTLAFGLRLRTPILQKSVTNCHYMPTLARKEARTAGNALSGQSYCLLNSRAGAEFQMRVLGSKHWDAIKPSAHVHDCQYGLVKRDPEVIKWLNDNIVECVQWQELPEIAHNEIKLTGELEIFYPSWCNETKLMPLISEEEISGILGQVLNG